MALSALPYKFKITSAIVEPGNTDTSVFFSILDGNNAVISSNNKIFAGADSIWNDVVAQLREAVFDQMATDAGGQMPLLQALVNKNVAVN